MTLTTRNQILVDSSSNAFLNAIAVVGGNTHINGPTTLDTYNLIGSSTSGSFNISNNKNYNKFEISTGHPIIKYSGTYVGQSNSTGVIDIPAEAEDGDYIILFFYAPSLTAITVFSYMYGPETIQQFSQGYNASNNQGTCDFVYQHNMRHIVITGNNTQSIYFLFVIKNSSNTLDTGTISSSNVGMPDPLAAPVSSFQALELYFATIATDTITPSAPTGTTMPLWIAHGGRTAMIAYRNNVRTQTFNPDAFGSTPAVTGIDWRVNSYTVPGKTQYTSLNMSISAGGQGPYLLDITYYSSGTITWSSNILWPANIAPVFSTPGSRHLVYLQKDSNNKLLGIHLPL